MSPLRPHVPPVSSRREFLLQAGHGLGALALTSLLGDDAGAAGRLPVAEDPLAPRPPEFEAKAKAVIFLFMDGGPSHLDTFDPKPELTRLHGQKLPASFGTVVTAMNTAGNTLMGSKWKFAKHGQSGIEVSELLPHIARCVDDLAVIRSCWADGINHVGSICQMNTGSVLAGRPSLGSWVLYGLGSVNRNLPAYVVMTDNREPPGGARNWGTGFMPATYQGTLFRNGRDPILHLSPPDEVDGPQERGKLDLLKSLNEQHRAGRGDDSELSARINAYELAFRMQAAAPEAVDLSQEPDWIKEEYGLERKECADFAHRCLLARRLVERGVRFVQIYCGGGSQWDAHSDILGNHTRMCARCDRPTAALLRDLKRRGLLDNTLVIWGGEFGRTPMSEGTGRDHNPFGFTMWMAGGGVKGGQVIGKTDEVGLHAIEDKVHVHDLHASILYLLGMHHRRLTYLHQGRNERLTINAGKVVNKLFE
jgi:hypothetical protein